MTAEPVVFAAPPHHPLAHAFSRAAERVLEGPRRWGSVDVSPTGRTSWSRTRLTIYPPGTNHAERRAIQFYRVWPVVGALLAVSTLLSLQSLPTLTATAVAASLYVVGLVASFSLTRTIRPRLKTVTVLMVPTGGGGIEVVGDVDFYDLATNEFRALDTLDRLGLITETDYERSWATIYNAA